MATALSRTETVFHAAGVGKHRDAGNRSRKPLSPAVRPVPAQEGFVAVALCSLLYVITLMLRGVLQTFVVRRVGAAMPLQAADVVRPEAACCRFPDDQRRGSASRGAPATHATSRTMRVWYYCGVIRCCAAKRPGNRRDA